MAGAARRASSRCNTTVRARFGGFDMAMATTADGVGIHYETTGEGRDVVLVHGITDSMLAWGGIPEMLGADYRVTTVDLRGHGESTDAPEYNALLMANDIGAVV